MAHLKAVGTSDTSFADAAEEAAGKIEVPAGDLEGTFRIRQASLTVGGLGGGRRYIVILEQAEDDA